MRENCIQCGYCCRDMELRILELVHPETFLKGDGLEFFKAHGLDRVLKNNEKIKILHSCQHLVDNRCGIQNDKPEYCKAWRCRRHLQDHQWARDRIGEFALECVNALSGLIDKNNASLATVIDALNEFKRKRDFILEKGEGS